VATADAAASALLASGVGKVIVTLGEHGALFANKASSQHFPAPRVKPVDTTAAGDTFVGGFAAALADGKSESEAIRFGQIAAALSVTRAGAQPSIPTFNDVQSYQP
jgi:ribokinase